MAGKNPSKPACLLPCRRRLGTPFTLPRTDRSTPARLAMTTTT